MFRRASRHHLKNGTHLNLAIPAGATKIGKDVLCPKNSVRVSTVSTSIMTRGRKRMALYADLFRARAITCVPSI
jgi:hypothetical protein